MTIEERAKEYNKKCTYACGMLCNVGELAYMKGAKNQQEMIIKWIKENIGEFLYQGNDAASYIEIDHLVQSLKKCMETGKI